MDELLVRETETEMYYADPEKGENKKMGEVETNMLHHLSVQYDR